MKRNKSFIDIGGMILSEKEYEFYKEIERLEMIRKIQADRIQELMRRLGKRTNKIEQAAEYVKCNYLTDNPLQFKIDLLKILEEK